MQSGGYYGEAAQRLGYVKAGQSYVISFKQFTDYMNDGIVTTPVFVTDNYGVAIDTCRQLNDSIRDIMNGVFQDEK